MEDMKANNFKQNKEDQDKVFTILVSDLVGQLAKDLKELNIDSITCLDTVDPNGSHREYRLKFTF